MRETPHAHSSSQHPVSLHNHTSCSCVSKHCFYPVGVGKLFFVAFSDMTSDLDFIVFDSLPADHSNYGQE